jgi:hypothetical protein
MSYVMHNDPRIGEQKATKRTKESSPFPSLPSVFSRVPSGLKLVQLMAQVSPGAKK